MYLKLAYYMKMASLTPSGFSNNLYSDHFQEWWNKYKEING